MSYLASINTGISWLFASRTSWQRPAGGNNSAHTMKFLRLVETLESRWLMAFSHWSAIQPAIALVPTSAGQLARASVVNFGTTVYTGPLNVMNTLNRIRADNGPDRSNDGAVYSNPQASGLPVDGTYYEFTVEPSGGTDRNFSNVSFPGPMRILLATGGDCFFTGDHYSTFQPVYEPGAATPTIGSFSDNPSSVTVGGSTVLTASNVTESGGTISAVNFYRESNGTGGLQIGSDTLIGTGSQNGSAWSLSTSTGGLSAGNYTYYAVATDASNVDSSAASTTLSITNPVGNPTIGAFIANPSSVTVGGSTVLTASNVVESGGTISSVSFYRESNGSGGLQTGSDTFVGNGSQSGNSWSLGTSTSGLSAGTYTYYAVATDANNVASGAASTTLSVTNAAGNPTIGAFSANPSSVTVGNSTILTASNVTESGGIISSVSFYRESNGTGGLQIGSDTFVGNGSQNGSTWTVSASTSGLSVGSYTYYAVATDSNSINSPAASTTLAVTNPATNGKILDWNVSGQTNFGAQGLAAGTVAASVTNSLGLTRGNGVSLNGTAAGNAWGGSNWASSSSAGISGNQFVTFGLTVNSGSTLSVSSLDMNYRHSGTGPTNGFWQYQVNGGSWATIGDFANEFSSSSSSGAAIAEINLAGIGSLQSLPGGTAVNFRVVPYGATSSGGTWYIYNTTGNDLLVNGSTTSGARAAQLSAFPAPSRAASPFNDQLSIGENDKAFFESWTR